MTGLDLFRLDGQTAVVVGGAGGLGAAMARGLAAAGAAVAVADANAAQAKLVADGIAAAGGRALAVAVDVANAASVERMAAEAEAALGPIDVLVNSAGITHRSPAADFPEAAWHRVIAVNLTGVFLGCQVVGRRMLARRRGRIVNIASIAGRDRAHRDGRVRGEQGRRGHAHPGARGGVGAPQRAGQRHRPVVVRVQHRRSHPPRAGLRRARDAPRAGRPHGRPPTS